MMKPGSRERVLIRKFARFMADFWLEYHEDSQFLINFFYHKVLEAIPEGKKIKVTIELEDQNGE